MGRFIRGQAYSEGEELLMDDCLVISESNFKDYFGPVFALHNNFALFRLNPNFHGGK
ncbi:hypothetical protein BGZ65_003519, partial [Modicella reniformis]